MGCGHVTKGSEQKLPCLNQSQNNDWPGTYVIKHILGYLWNIWLENMNQISRMKENIIHEKQFPHFIIWLEVILSHFRGSGNGSW